MIVGKKQTRFRHNLDRGIPDFTARCGGVTVLNWEQGPMQEDPRNIPVSVAEDDRRVTQLRALVRGLLAQQETDGRQVARELHDDFSQRLARMEMDADQLERDLDRDLGAARRRLDALRAAIGSLSADLRAISRRLHPSIVEHLGLGAALRALVDDFRDREQMTAAYFEENVPEAVAGTVALAIYRIAQEALDNVAAHAGKTRVRIMLRGGAGRLRLEVWDGGAGFDPAEARAGLGLIAMEERAIELGGTLVVGSATGAGTRVVVEIPVSAETG
jgi:signal transduction histidine kinase